MSNLLKQDFLSPKDIEAKFGIPEGTLTQWRFHGRGPAYFKLGRRVVYAASEVESWLQKRKVLTSDALESSAQSR